MSGALFQVAVAVQDGSGNWVFLPDVGKVTPDVAPDQLTTMTIDYPVNGHAANLLAPGKLIRVYYKKADGFWATPRNGTYRLVHQGGDDVSRKTSTWTARSLWGEFDRAVLLQAPDFVAPVRDLGEFDQHHPRSWPNGSTVGQILARAVLESKGRGELADIDTSLVREASDANGKPWSIALPPEEQKIFNPLGTLVRSLSERGYVSVQFDGMKLLLLDPASVGVDRSATVELMPSRDMTEAPFKVQTEAVANRVYVKGDDAAIKIVDAPDIDMNNVRAVAVEASGIKDPSVLQRIGEMHLAEVNRVQREVTVGIDCWASKFLPWRDFDVDDTVTVAYGGGGSEKHQVRQITVEQTDKGVRASVVLGDRIPDPELKLAQQVRAIQNDGVRGLGATGFTARPATSIAPSKLTPALKKALPDALDDLPTDAMKNQALVHVFDHGTNANAARPNVNGTVYWTGSDQVQPVNHRKGDFWYDGRA